MAFVVKDRVQETCNSPGTGTVTLLGAATGYQTFSAGIGNANNTFYAIADQGGTNWEVGYGTYSSTGNTLTRTIVLSSSNGGSLTNFSTGIQNVWCDYPAGKAVLLDSNSKINAGGNGYLDFASAAPAVIAGRQWYDGTTGSWNLGMGGGNITQQIGEELFVYGKASAAITDSPLQIIKQTAPVGSSGVIGFAPTTAGITDGNLIIGVATESIALNGFGRITCFGTVRGITTDGVAYGETWADGDVIWYNPVTGNPTNVKPVAPNIKVQVGTIINAGNGGSGSIAVEINHGSVLGGTDSNVQLTSATGGQILTYNQTGAYWINTALGAGTGFSATTTAGGGLTVGASVAAIGTWMGTPSSANLAAAMTDETGTGLLVFNNSPTFITPTLGTPVSGTLTNCTGLPNGGLLNSSVTFNGVSVALGASGTITATATNALTIGTGLSGTSYNGSAAVTIANTGVLSFSGGTTGLTPSTATTGAVTLAGTLAVGNGGTGLSSLTANRIPYGNGTSAFSSSSTFTYSGSLLSVNGTSGLAGLGNAQLALNPATGGAYYVANRSSSSAGEVGFAFETAGAISWINYVPTSGTSLNWYNGSANVMYLTSGGNLTFTQSNAGIYFNNGAGSLLNYYEVGTYSPTVTNTSGSISYTASGSYVRVGKMVSVAITVIISSATAGTAVISVPFACQGVGFMWSGRENAATGYSINGYGGSGSSSGGAWLYNNSGTAITGYNLLLTTTYAAA